MKKTSFVAVVAAVALMLSSCGGNGELKKTAMEINGYKISGGDVAALIVSEAGVDSFDDAKDQIVDLIEDYMKIEALGDAMDIELTAEEEMSATDLRAQVASSNGGYKAYKKYLEENSASLDFVEKLGKANAYYSHINEKVEESLAEKETTDEEIKAYYNENYMCVKHILIKVDEEKGIADMDAAKAKADEVLAKLNDGGDFVALMKEYSDDKDTDGNDNCGETGYVFKDGDFGNPAFEEAAAALGEGEYTKEAVKVEGGSYSGYHIIMRLALPSEMGENEDSIRSAYQSKMRDDALDALCEEYGIEIKINQDVIDALKADMLTEKPQTQSEDVQY